jgi:hypothetical protein
VPKLTALGVDVGRAGAGRESSFTDGAYEEAGHNSSRPRSTPTSW